MSKEIERPEIEGEDTLDEYKEVMSILKNFCNELTTAEQAITIIHWRTGWPETKCKKILTEIFKD